MNVRVIAEKAVESQTGRSAAKKQTADFSINSATSRILFLHRTIGNQAVQKLFRSGLMQAKLKIGEPDDIYEQEADRVADIVMRMHGKDSVSVSESVSEGNKYTIQLKPG